MQKISKNFIQFRQHIRTLNLSINEQYLLELFFEFHNAQYGYCFLKVSDILKAFNTTSKNRVSTVIKSLEEKGLITVDRENKNNRYFIKGMNDFINVIEEVMPATTKEKVEKKKDKKESKEEVIEGQIEADVAAEAIEIVNNVITIGQASQELKDIVVSKDIEEVKTVIAAVKSNNNGVVTSSYILNAFNKKAFTPAIKETINPLKFNNFEGREYDYNKLGAMLTGEIDYNENDIHEVLSNKKTFNGIQIGA